MIRRVRGHQTHTFDLDHEIILQMAPAPASRSAILRLMNASRHVACPCHSCSGSRNAVGGVMNTFRKFATPIDLPTKEYAFEVCILSDTKLLD